LGLLNISLQTPIQAPEEPSIVNGRECSKKFVQQGRSPFDARSVLSVREHGKKATPVCASCFGKARERPLAAFFNIPRLGNIALSARARLAPLLMAVNIHSQRKSVFAKVFNARTFLSLFQCILVY